MVFTNHSSLTVHIKTHTGDRPFVCDDCGASFLSNSYLTTHQRKHTGERPYKCDQCDSSFILKNYLTVHKRKHTGERPFKCDICDASFTQRTPLTTHRRKHTGERPYKCDQCDASFILKNYLTVHKRIHSGERPFKCDICDVSFTQKTSLSTHKRIHTGECPYKCQECDKTFSNGSSFWHHKKKHLISDSSSVIIKQHKNKKLRAPDKRTFKKRKPKKHETSSDSDNAKKIQSKISVDKHCSKEKDNPKKTISKVKRSKKEGSKKKDNAKNKYSRSKINVDKHSSGKIKDDSKKANRKTIRSKKEESKKQDVIEVIILSDSDEVCDIAKSEMFLKEKVDTIRESKAMDDVFWEIDKIFDLLEESTEGIWKRTPNQIEQDLYEVLLSLKLERFEDSSYPNIYNLDINYRQLYIYYSGVDAMLQKHALLCKHRYPNCKDIPDKHQDDLSCCI